MMSAANSDDVITYLLGRVNQLEKELELAVANPPILYDPMQMSSKIKEVVVISYGDTIGVKTQYIAKIHRVTPSMTGLKIEVIV